MGVCNSKQGEKGKKSQGMRRAASFDILPQGNSGPILGGVADVRNFNRNAVFPVDDRVMAPPQFKMKTSNPKLPACPVKSPQAATYAGENEIDLEIVSLLDIGVDTSIQHLIKPAIERRADILRPGQWKTQAGLCRPSSASQLLRSPDEAQIDALLRPRHPLQDSIGPKIPTDSPQMEGRQEGRPSAEESFTRSEKTFSERSPMNCSKELTTFQYKKGGVISSSAFSCIYQCLDINTGHIFAVKTIKLSGSFETVQREVNALKDEITLLKTLSHKNIVRYYHTEICEDSKGVDIVLEFVPGGSLDALIAKFGKLSERIAAIYTKQILEGLAYLHSHNIIHREVKCSNILIDTDGTIKLTDFGASRRINLIKNELENPQQCNEVPAQKVNAIDVSGEKIDNFDKDITDLANVVIEMLSGAICPSRHGKQSSQRIRPMLVPPRNCTPACLDFINKIRSGKPTPSASDLLEHPFIKDPAAETTMQTINEFEITQSLMNTGRLSLANMLESANLKMLGNELALAGITTPFDPKGTRGETRNENKGNAGVPRNPSLFKRKKFAGVLDNFGAAELQLLQQHSQQQQPQQQGGMKRSDASGRSGCAGGMVNHENTVINTIAAAEMREKYEKEQVELKRAKAEKLKQWEEALKRELEGLRRSDPVEEGTGNPTGTLC